jgi:hypothetical protein
MFTVRILRPRPYRMGQKIIVNKKNMKRAGIQVIIARPNRKGSTRRVVIGVFS